MKELILAIVCVAVGVGIGYTYQVSTVKKLQGQVKQSEQGLTNLEAQTVKKVRELRVCRKAWFTVITCVQNGLGPKGVAHIADCYNKGMAK